MYAPYRCTECLDIQEYHKPYGVEFPEVLECPFCRTMTAKRYYSSMPHFEVAEGIVGNTKNGFTKNATYIQAPSSPVKRTNDFDGFSRLS